LKYLKKLLESKLKKEEPGLGEILLGAPNPDSRSAKKTKT